MLAALSRLRYAAANIMTVEDPIECDLVGIGQTQVNERIGMDFARASLDRSGYKGRLGVYELLPMISESALADKRGFYASMSQMGVGGGFVLSIPTRVSLTLGLCHIGATR
jgi:type II secretory ATPase GspE/PulE/Tfp pilus assembly ATPase PilB-like protein